MKLGGVRPPVNVKTLVLEREGNKPLVFKAGAITDMSEFDRLCPEPVPPDMLKRGEKVPNYKDKGYLLAVSQQSGKRMNYIILTSLKATENLEWSTVDYGDPSTWENWRKECLEAGISLFEVNRIVALVIDANGLNDQLLDAAKASFLAEQAETHE